MKTNQKTLLIALSILLISMSYGFAQINEFAEDPAANANSDPLKSEYPDIVSPVTDCPDIASKYRSGGSGSDAMGYPADFGFAQLSDSDKQACIKEINKDGDIVEGQETKEENSILQN
ncbi:hypothetical protein PsAD2_01698 [Pseudovibrio axinellae]|uniref:Secreted protein n=1 Tax=Pseudovibrio axinellae TaxID=989403 RepID=A0A165ZGK7_9HYPH|nr:hypothetical protein [Pseudovibrio axinellae]KZL19876.1 hypothetical protein PsAD2_01698 [Pseudovibrio axinellae]SER38492.1 hypothetical protein SAMN05421798_10966 [Pseudovibrio axinellae]